MADRNADACPVDHKAREAWLEHARAADASKSQATPAAVCPVDHTAKASKPASWSQTISSYLPWSSSGTPPHPQQPPRPTTSASTTKSPGLGTNRVISTIPRSTANASACPVDHGASANAEIETGRDESGNWVYPSEKMFFDAMRRKGHEAREGDMKTVVPIHNAVNERAWAQILTWESPYLAQSQYVYPPSTRLSFV